MIRVSLFQPPGRVGAVWPRVHVPALQSTDTPLPSLPSADRVPSKALLHVTSRDRNHCMSSSLYMHVVLGLSYFNVIFS